METTTSTYETAPQTQPGVWSVGMKGGLYTGLVFIVFSLITFLAELQQDSGLSTIFMVISFIVGIYLTHKAFKDQGNGFMSYGQGLGLGVVLGLVSGIIGSLFSVIYMTFIDETIIARQMEIARIQLEEQGMSDAQIEQAMEISEMMMSPVALFFIGILTYIVVSFIVSLIVSAFTKNTDPSVEF
ncbi:DUF4199 domain-containing protein [Nafulsella turpanensis]|uniref:DUF4199 domain-containing protein n=1 Tax=Nafulsella turpanensis TaxID=1265690 RepID=UPI0006865D40|nr:DUF4199 domain-containing protein [Nafulsella turpanensis]